MNFDQQPPNPSAAAAMGDDNWRTPTFRQSVVAKIDEAIRQSGMNTSRNSIEMENHVFLKAKNKEEYLGFVARLILHVREMNSKKGQPGMNGQGPQQGGPGMPDPINALQNLASQGTRNPGMGPMGMGGSQPGQIGGPQQGPASSLLQTLNRGPQGQQMMMGGMGGNMPMQNMGMNQNAGPMAGQMGGQMSTQMQMQLQAQAQQQGMGGPMGPGQMGPGQMGPGGPGQMGPGQMGQMGMGPMGGQMMGMQMQPKPTGPGGQMMMTHPNMGPGGGFARQPNPNMFNASPMQQSVQSPAGVGGQMGVGAVPSPIMAPSPGGGMGMMQGGPRSIPMAPSPGGSSLNTPAGQSMQSPMGAGNTVDDAAYREKVRQLSKYIEPLRKMIAKMGTETIYNDKMQKMKKLLEILSNPHQRMPLDTLLKCEVVLEKIDFKRSEGSAPGSNVAQAPFKEPHVFSALLDAVSAILPNPNANHTLHRTFGPPLETLYGPELKTNNNNLKAWLDRHHYSRPTMTFHRSRVSPPPKRRKREKSPDGEIPDVLQGEIARLDPKFKVALNPDQQPGTKQIKLDCLLEDRNLPSVPPISLTVPEDYPSVSPECHVSPEAYGTPFFVEVADALKARLTKLPKHYSVSHVLDTWEMAVRQSCSPKTNCPITAMAMLMGL